ncbi:class I SAM-dependent methyltransferase [Rhodanobacter sp. DHB23]|uniref:class I SAM-dependent methyltransferase n=1 Tax=Rhodanobacter sp. DHB23 TaxID=2775923 RepID=UPI00177DC98F|nr:class I SAM-dependent methyltransferase [Rhodanobacter sp. DHB23]MBD8872523.1 class I SAM-dependent methyltransferase [Rhodanobacter sp. DHB23]
MREDRIESTRGDQPRFGIDAPTLVLGFAIGGPLLVALSFIDWLAQVQALLWTIRNTGLVLCLEAILMTLSSLYGKRILLRRMVDSLALRGDEQALDVGCGRGMLLLETASRLPRGRVTGLDLWSTRDQSGNAAAATARNAELAGLRERVQIDTGDMRQLPYADASFDVIVSSLAIHNLPTETDREQAVREIVRVLKPGGQVALLDFRRTAHYAQTLREAGLDTRRSWPLFLMFPWVWIVRGRKA